MVLHVTEFLLSFVCRLLVNCSRPRRQVSSSGLVEPRQAPKPVVKTRCLQLSSKMLQLVLGHCCLVGREVRSQTSLSHNKRSGSHAAVPLITRGAEQKKPETQRITAQRLSANLAVKIVTPQLTSNNLREPQIDVARRSQKVQSAEKVPRSHHFKSQPII